MTPEQSHQFNEMYEWFKQMQKSSAIPRSTEVALTERIFNHKDLIITLPVSDILPADRDQTTSAGGGDLVPQVPTGLQKCLIQGESAYKYFPFYQ